MSHWSCHPRHHQLTCIHRLPKPLTYAKPANSPSSPQQESRWMAVAPWKRTVYKFPMVLEVYMGEGMGGHNSLSSFGLHRWDVCNMQPILMHREGGCHFLYHYWHPRPLHWGDSATLELQIRLALPPRPSTQYLTYRPPRYTTCQTTPMKALCHLSTLRQETR